MLAEPQFINVPLIPGLTEQVLHGIGVRNLKLEISPQVDQLLRRMNGFDIENYIETRLKEHISAHIFTVLMQESNHGTISISTTSLVQDIQNGQDVRLRGLYGNQELVYADMTGNPGNYEKKKRGAISGSENKIYIYVPHNLTVYCYKGLQRNEMSNTPKEAIRILIEEYGKQMKEDEVIEIKTYDLRGQHEEKTYLFRR